MRISSAGTSYSWNLIKDHKPISRTIVKDGKIVDPERYQAVIGQVWAASDIVERSIKNDPRRRTAGRAFEIREPVEAATEEDAATAWAVAA